MEKRKTDTNRIHRKKDRRRRRSKPDQNFSCTRRMFGSFANSKVSLGTSEDYALVSSLVHRRSVKNSCQTTQEMILQQVELNRQICPMTSLSSLMLHSIVGQLEHDEFNFPYTQYVMTLEDPRRSGRKWEIRRRYSSMERFRTNVLFALKVPHCHYCAELVDRLRSIPFPSRCLWGSLNPEVVRVRIHRFEAFVRELLKITGLPHFKICNKLRSNVRTMIHAFFTHEATINKCLEYKIPCLLEVLTTSTPGTGMDTIFEVVEPS